ncbi:MAG: DUF401 family protein [Proteobacteria bacterium]|nr:DUF401 family protein [Pseudomonadota bacterium]
MWFLMDLPAFARVLLVFCIILIAIRRKMALGNAFLLGSVVLGLFFGLGLIPMAKTMYQSIIDPQTLSLAIIVSLILVLSNSLEKAGQMQRLLHSFRGLIKNPRINIVVFPALIGLLPMPGGAIFSAPMVKDLGTGIKLSKSKLSYINYWFRHIWEYCWPLYPGILLVTILAKINIVNFVLFTLPITLVAVLLGYWPLQKGSDWNHSNRETARQQSIYPFFIELTPILLVIVPGLILGVVLSYMLPQLSIAKELGLHISLCLGIIWVWISNQFDWKRILKLLSSFEILKMIYLVATILVFKGLLEHSHAAEEISKELIEFNVPLLFIAMFLPFLIGIISGYTLAFVGVSVPILIPLIQSYGESAFMYPYAMLIMVSGFAGVLLSPLHLCYILSNQYFETKISSVYKHLMIPTIGLISFSIAYFLVSYRFFF